MQKWSKFQESFRFPYSDICKLRLIYFQSINRKITAILEDCRIDQVNTDEVQQAAKGDAQEEW
jgi:hypothetical protein